VNRELELLAEMVAALEHVHDADGLVLDTSAVKALGAARALLREAGVLPRPVRAPQMGFAPVTLPDGLVMDAVPVTQADWRTLMGTDPSHFHGDDLPVEQVSWWAAVAYCNARSERDNLRSVYDYDETHVEWDRAADGWRLPTESEWERACLAGGTVDPYGPLDEIAWWDGNSDGTTHPVGQKTPNVWGLYDMLGNVWEWCWDPWDAGSMNRVVRGGSWGISAGVVRASLRGGVDPGRWVNLLGFRCARGAVTP